MTITIANFCEFPIFIKPKSNAEAMYWPSNKPGETDWASNKPGETDWTSNKPGETYKFKIFPGDYQKSYRFAICSINQEISWFPVFNEGAPRSNNDFCVFADGVYLNGSRVKVWEKRGAALDLKLF